MMMMPQNLLQPMVMMQQPGQTGKQLAWGGVQSSPTDSREGEEEAEKEEKEKQEEESEKQKPW